VSSHNITDFLLRFCNKYIILDEGEMISAGVECIESSNEFEREFINHISDKIKAHKKLRQNNV
jgi:hypothetical protein